MVAINHLAAMASPFSMATAPMWLQASVALSGIGMTLFFVLSGFVITYNYFDDDWQQRPIQTAASFAWRRFSRLYPALILFLFIATPHYNFFDRDRLVWLLIHAASIETWLPFKVAGNLPGTGMYYVSWSIGTEIGLYLIFTIFVISISAGRALRFAAIISALLYLCFVMAMIDDPGRLTAITQNRQGIAQPFTDRDWWLWFFYLSPYYRIVEFALGAIAALSVMRLSIPGWALRVTSTLAVAGVGVVHAWWFVKPWGIVISIPMIQIIFATLAAVIMAGSAQASRINAVLASPPLIFLGLISYSLYLFHQMVPWTIGITPGTEPFSWSLLPLFAGRLATVLAAAAAVSWGIYSIVEMPVQRKLRSLGRTAMQPVLVVARNRLMRAAAAICNRGATNDVANNAVIVASPGIDANGSDRTV